MKSQETGTSSPYALKPVPSAALEYHHDVISWNNRNAGNFESDLSDSEDDHYDGTDKPRSHNRGKSNILRISVNSFDEVIDFDNNSIHTNDIRGELFWKKRFEQSEDSASSRINGSFTKSRDTNFTGRLKQSVDDLKYQSLRTSRERVTSSSSSTEQRSSSEKLASDLENATNQVTATTTYSTIVENPTSSSADNLPRSGKTSSVSIGKKSKPSHGFLKKVPGKLVKILAPARKLSRVNLNSQIKQQQQQQQQQQSCPRAITARRSEEVLCRRRNSDLSAPNYDLLNEFRALKQKREKVDSSTKSRFSQSQYEETVPEDPNAINFNITTSFDNESNSNKHSNPKLKFNSDNKAKAPLRRTKSLGDIPEFCFGGNVNEAFYNLESKLYDGKAFRFGDHLRGKVVLICNVATYCMLFFYLKKLEQLYEKYKDRGLVVIAFTSNDFMQEPFNSKKTGDRCVTTFNMKFPVMEKVSVNGSKQHPVYRFLKNQKVPARSSKLGLTEGNYGVGSDGRFSRRIFWNYEKFLVDSNGNMVRRFWFWQNPLKLGKYIEEYLPN